jgi:hypothetical protein
LNPSNLLSIFLGLKKKIHSGLIIPVTGQKGVLKRKADGKMFCGSLNPDLTGITILHLFISRVNPQVEKKILLGVN